MRMDNYESRMDELLKKKDGEISHLQVYCADLEADVRRLIKELESQKEDYRKIYSDKVELEEYLEFMDEDKPYDCEAIYIKKELYSFLKDVAMIDASKPEDIVVDLIYVYLQDKMFYED